MPPRPRRCWADGDPDHGSRARPGVEVQLRRARTLIPTSDTALDATWHCSRAALLAGRPTRAEAQREARTGTVLAEGAREQARVALGCRFVTARLLLDAGKSFAAADSMALIAAGFTAIHDVAERGLRPAMAAYALSGVGEYGWHVTWRLPPSRRAGPPSNFSAVAWADLNLTGIAYLVGDLESASHTLAEAESLFVQQGDNWGFAALQGYKAGLAESNGDLDRARAVYQAALPRLAAFDPDGAIQFLVHLASIARRQGNYPVAARAPCRGACDRPKTPNGGVAGVAGLLGRTPRTRPR